MAEKRKKRQAKFYVAEKKILTPRQAKFVKEYLVDLNATQAAIRSGYSPKTAQEQSSRLLTKVLVKDAIKKEQSRVGRKTGITIENCLTEYAKIAFANIAESVADDGTLKPVSEFPPDLQHALSALEISTSAGRDGTQIGTLSRIRTVDKTRALDSIMRHLGGFCDKKKIEIEDSVSQIISALPENLQKHVIAVLSESE